MRQFITVLILASMLLHSMSRLGVVEYLYSERHSIAHTLGIIEEVPMAMCNSDYAGNIGLVYVDIDQTTQTPSLPLHVASEIHLFLFPQPTTLSDALLGSIVSHSTYYGLCHANVFTSMIFHPPALA